MILTHILESDAPVMDADRNKKALSTKASLKYFTILSTGV